MNVSDVAEIRVKVFQSARENGIRTKLEGLWETGPFYTEKCIMNLVNEFPIHLVPGDGKQQTCNSRALSPSPLHPKNFQTCKCSELLKEHLQFGHCTMTDAY